MEAFARPTGRVPVDPERGTGGGEYPPFPNTETTQPKLDARVDYDFPDGNQRLFFAGGFAGPQGIIHPGVGRFTSPTERAAPTTPSTHRSRPEAKTGPREAYTFRTRSSCRSTSGGSWEAGPMP